MPIFRSLPSLKDSNVYSSVDVIDNKLFVFGGCNKEGKAQKSVQLMNLSDYKEFIRIKDMPRVKAGAAIAHINHKVISLGGIYDKQCPLDNVDILDIESNCWSETAPLYQPVQGHFVSVRDDVIYCGGGVTSEMATLNNFQMMDLSSGKWQTLPNMTAPHFYPGSFQYQNNLYVIGGRQGKKSVKDCECYDFRASNWRKLPSIPDEFRNVFSSYVHCNDQIYVIGGLHEDPKNGFSNLSFVFNLQSEKWEKLPNILKPRADFGAFSCDDKVIIAGGMGQLQGLPTSTEIFNPVSKKWNLGDDLPNAHTSSSKCIYEGSMFLVGGMIPGGLSNNVTLITSAI